jgi:hypothetical protein
MFIGHYAVGFAAKKYAPRTSLAVLMIAPLFLDLLWPIFVLAGWERARIDPGNTAVTPLDFISYPISHSLLMAVVWATLLAVVYFWPTRYWAGTVAIWIGVVSHWILDFVSHRPDMPIFLRDGPKLGLGLWNSRLATLGVEGLLFACGVWLYASSTRPKDKSGSYGLWSFVGLLVVLYLGNFFSPPPPSVNAVAIVGLCLAPLLLWVWWFDRHRTAPKGSSSSSP